MYRYHPLEIRRRLEERRLESSRPRFIVIIMKNLSLRRRREISRSSCPLLKGISLSFFFPTFHFKIFFRSIMIFSSIIVHIR